MLLVLPFSGTYAVASVLLVSVFHGVLVASSVLLCGTTSISLVILLVMIANKAYPDFNSDPIVSGWSDVYSVWARWMILLF